MPIASINPATGETVATFEELSATEIERRVALAAAAFRSWRKTPFATRSAVLVRAAEILEAEKRRFGEILTLEMGKPIGAAVAEVEKCAGCCRFYAEHGAGFLADEPAETDAKRSFVRYDPIGVVLAVMPWNFPFWQVFRFAAPAVMAGNVGLLKHASNVPQAALAIEEIFTRAGAPEGVFQTLLVGSGAVEALIGDPRIAAVTLTGSEGAGVAVGRAAGAQIKKAVLELGGSDPFVVMPSADLPAAIATAVKARTINNGQSCIAAKRFIVHRDIAAEFERGFVEKMAALEVGDPMDPKTEIGPLATGKILDELDDQVQRSIAAGTRCLTGGKRLDRKGNFYPPTVLADPPEGSPAYAEETFGPVAVLFTVDNLDQAIDLANATTFGLGASAWSTDPAEQERLIAEIEAGSVFINGMVKSDPRLPFGGIKRSGFGRELSAHGIREFVNVKTVWVG
ncbi:MAG TPA: NAD-dependent succinate-semialdehyde dehydrogenase [Thermoanaerobaculia bacterium]|jgi:succinate-semialdehyde dehydrogenase/glutarate-semialdehyde dehydrogenase|nr:NAD-dependent succinate-semialdehyde dehydrogenase [Thermoanaerobaculia bacterium]